MIRKYDKRVTIKGYKAWLTVLRGLANRSCQLFLSSFSIEILYTRHLCQCLNVMNLKRPMKVIYSCFLFPFFHLKSNLIQLFFVRDNLVIVFSVPIFLTQI